ncbi:casparian strip membrane protein 2-like [Zingiber officinale]|uniref:casparian strip membrane protein 2-like n=1 Tax=Zingiber officinale TaxID=94328 RepID=UPI001C4C38A3|nr:casparian strip membrane protein 2-like [Zingiber officinale]
MSTSADAAPATVIPVDEHPASDTRGKAPVATAPPPPPPPPRTFPFFLRNTAKGAAGGCQRALALLDFVLRLCGIAATLVAAVTMGTTNETLPFVTQLFQFRANFTDLPALLFFVIANGIAAGYLVLSLPFSIAGIVRPQATCPRFFLFFFDSVMVAFTSSAASAAAAIVYLAHNGSSRANWVAICLPFDGFCQRISGAVVAAFIAVVFFMVSVLISGLLLRKARI